MSESKRKVLLIDDERGAARIIEAAFSKFERDSYDLHWAQTYEEGLTQLCTGEYSVCLLDYQLGKRNGLELMREPSLHSVNTPVIFLTYVNTGDLDVLAMDAGALDYLVKSEINPRALERSLRYTLRLQETLMKLSDAATRDILTGLYNQKEGLRIMENEVTRARQFDRPLTILLINVDNMKMINDTLGNVTGDKMLFNLAHAIQDEVRSVDFVIRWGGDEFAVLLVESDAVEGRDRSESIRELVKQLGCTVSIGVSEWNASRGGVSELVDAADKALCEAKWSGRDRVA
jgi:diguanylate cyclase (GGDEF)-like protein